MLEDRFFSIPDNVTIDHFGGKCSIFKCKIGMTFEEAMRLLNEQGIAYELSEGKNYKEISTTETLQSFFVKQERERYDLVIYGNNVIDGICFNWGENRGLYAPKYIPYADEGLLSIKDWLSGKLDLPFQVKSFKREKISVVYGLRDDVICVKRTPEDYIIDLCRYSDYKRRNQGLIEDLYYSLKGWILKK